MFLYLLVSAAYHGSRRLPRTQRLKFQIVNAVFILVVLIPQIYIMARPKSSRFCRQPLLINLCVSVAFSFIASGFSLLFTLLDPVPQSLWASFHLFGLLSCGHGLSTSILTLTAAECVKSTPELYHLSAALTVASAVSAGVLLLRGGLWLSNRRRITPPHTRSCHRMLTSNSRSSTIHELCAPAAAGNLKPRGRL